MVKLPSRESLGEMPSARSGRPIAHIDLSAPAKAQVQLGQAISGLAGVLVETSQATDKFETERKYQEFKWAEQQSLDQSMRGMEPGQASGFSDSWVGGYKERAKEFLSTVPDSLKGEYDNKLFSTERDFYGSAATFARSEQKRSAANAIEDMRNNVYYRRATSAEDIGKVRSDYKGLVDTNPFMSPVEKDELFRKTFSDLEEEHIRARAKRGEDIDAIRRDLHGAQAPTDTDIDTETRAKPFKKKVKTEGAIELLKQLEGFSPRRYSDFKQNSIGYGTKAKPNELAITREEAEVRLREEAGDVAAVVDRNLPGIDGDKRAALISFGYNLGTGDGGLADLIPNAKAGKWDDVAAQMQKYVHAGGAVNAGLVSRRQREGRLILGKESVGDSPVPGETPAFTGPYQQLSIDRRRILDEWLRGAKEAKTAEERSKLTQQLNDDVESVRDSGMSRIPPAEIDRAKKVLGEGVVGTYLTKRKQADMEYTNLHDMDSMPDIQLEQRVADLVPKAGEPDYAIKDDVFKKAEKKKNDLIQERLHNPASAVDKLPELQEPLAIYRENPDDPAAVQNLIRARLDAQAKLNIPSLQRQPITKDEAIRLVRPALGVAGTETKEKLIPILAEMQSQIENTYGKYAPSVARSAIQIAVQDHDQAQRIQGIISRAWKGLPIRSSEIREMERLNEIKAAEEAVKIYGTIPSELPVVPPSERPGQAPAGIQPVDLSKTASPINPPSGFQEPASTFSGMAGQPIQVKTVEEARKLPSGTPFYDPNGTLRVR